MNYKITFYNNIVELLTERNANFINKVKHLTSRVFNELAKKTNQNGKTSAISILQHLKEMTSDEKTTWRTSVMLDDYKNLELPMLPNTGKPIPFKFKFNLNGSHFKTPSFETKGHCLHQTIRGKKFIAEIYIEMDIYLTENFDPQNNVRHFINTFQGALTHEIAHAQDEFLGREIDGYVQKGNTSDEDLKYLVYWLKPTEIRSHMLEMVQLLSSNSYNNPNRTFRNMYKTAAKAEEIGMKHTQEQKDRTKRAYSILKKNYDNTEIDKRAKDSLLAVLNRAFNGHCPKLTKQFIFDYHIAFVKEYNDTMKQRYYDKFFSNTPTQPLDKMNDFFDAIKTVTRTFTKLKKEIEKRYRSYYGNPDQETVEMVQEFNKMITELWEEGDLTPAFNDYDPKLLKKIGKKIVESFREKYGLMTKGMMTKAAKEYIKSLER